MIGFAISVIILIALYIGCRRGKQFINTLPTAELSTLEAMRGSDRYGDRDLRVQQRKAEQVASMVKLGRLGLTTVQLVALLLVVWQFVSLSLFYVPEYHAAHVVKRFGGSSMKSGEIIALNGENGPQVTIYPDGWKFVPFLGIYADIEILPAVYVPPGAFGEVVALDGRPLPEDAVIAPPIPGTSIAPHAPDLEKTEVKDEDGNVHYAYAVFDAESFLRKGYGYKGLQSTVLKPGVHRLNLYLFNVRVTEADGRTTIYDKTGTHGGVKDRQYVPTTVTEIPTGTVGVIKSNMVEDWRTPEQCSNRAEKKELGELTAVLVPDGCKGVWTTTFEPGAYFLNRAVYEVTTIETRAQRWTYKGGYSACTIDLTLNEDGSFSQARDCEKQEVLDDYADSSIFVKVEGWDIPVELRVLVQVKPEDAPAVVAAVGSVKEIEDRIITPSIRSVVRNIGGGAYLAPLYDEDGKPRLNADGTPLLGRRPARALDFQDHREALERAFEAAIIQEANKAGVTVLEVKIGEPAIPPELLVSRRREQLAQQLAKAFQQEKLAQDQRVSAENAKATANQQTSIVAAEVNLRNSDKNRQARENEGRGERAYLEEIAAGQKAQAAVLGDDKVVLLQGLKDILQALKEEPRLVGLIPQPQTLILGSGSSLESAAAVATQGLKGTK